VAEMTFCERVLSIVGAVLLGDSARRDARRVEHDAARLERRA
jgi:hypothetical protein